jgi:hypothetical protein
MLKTALILIQERQSWLLAFQLAQMLFEHRVHNFSDVDPRLFLIGAAYSSVGKYQSFQPPEIGAVYTVEEATN